MDIDLANLAIYVWCKYVLFQNISQKLLGLLFDVCFLYIFQTWLHPLLIYVNVGITHQDRIVQITSKMKMYKECMEFNDNEWLIISMKVYIVQNQC